MMLTILAIAVPLIHVCGGIAAIYALLNTRTSQGAIAWALVLAIFPYLALPLYIIFGRNKFEGYSGAINAARVISKEKLESIIKEISPYFQHEAECPDLRTFEVLGELPFSTENNAELLIDGEATFNSIFDAIRNAKKYILFQFFIIRDDNLGQRVKEELINKAKQGIRVCFIFDSIGSFSLPNAYLEELRAGGVNVASFGVLKKRLNRLQINFRNHRKIVVVDGDISFVGGHNVGDEYLGKSERFGHWRDTHIKNKGAVVKAVQMIFAYDWYWATGEALGLNWEVCEVSSPKVKMLAIASGPGDSIEKCTLLFLNAINSAKNRIWISSPYFVPNSSILDALTLAALRGVDVRIILPKKPDHKLVYLASFSFLYLTENPNIKFFRYSKGFLHQKAFLVDEHIAAIGTANFDYRSFRLNFEITMLAEDVSFSSKVREMLETDLKDSEPTDNFDYSSKSRIFRLAVRLARLLSPVL